MTTNRFLLFLFLFIQMVGSCQSTQYGVVLEYHGDKSKTPLKNVQIIAGGVSDISDENGTFSLTFKSLKDGDALVPSRISKSGYVLFNREAVKSWRVNEKAPLQIVLCKKEKFDELVATYYDISFKSYKDQYDKECEKVKQLKRDGLIQEKEYLDKLEKAYDQYLNVLNKLEQNAEKLAYIDLTEISEIEKQALLLTQAGKIDSAIFLIESVEVETKIKNTLQIIEKGDSLIKVGKLYEAEVNYEFKELMSRIEYLIQLYVSEGSDESANKILILLDKFQEINFPDEFEKEMLYHRVLSLIKEKQGMLWDNIIVKLNEGKTNH